MTHRDYRTQPPKIAWDDAGPKSIAFSDHYWSKGDPRLEKKAVFAAQHNLKRRAQQAEQFVLLELGFGFGQNFLQTAELWAQDCAQSILHYIAIEIAPPSLLALKKVLTEYDSDFSDQLIKAYPPQVEGWFTVWLGANIRLTLIFEDVRTALPQLDARVDAFYLDGFKPSQNPEIFNPHIFQRLYGLAQPGATLSTYSVAGVVKQGLSASGFAIEKRTGFGQKRALLFAEKPGAWQGQSLNKRNIQIVGAGIASQALQESLARFGFNAAVFADPAQTGSSSQPIMKLYPQLALQRDLGSEFSLAASYFALQHNLRITPASIAWHSNVADKQRRMAKLSTLLPDEVLEHSGENFVYHLAGIWRPESSAQNLQRAAVDHIRIRGNQTQLMTRSGGLISSADITIIAAGIGTLGLTDLGLRCVRGQSIQIQSNQPLPRALTGDLNVTLLQEDRFLVGSTYHLDASNPAPDGLDTAQLVNKLSALLGHTDFEVLSEHAGVRAAYPDRKIGFGAIRSSNLAGPGISDPCSEADASRLFALTGLGSHGSTHASLAAEAMISSIVGAPNVTPRAHLTAFRPDRSLRQV